ncbi:MAG: phosphoribosyltransferase [Candidatus Micrarchaeia archaeon]
MTNEKISCKILTWDDVDDLCKKLASKVSDANYKPDMIIGLARGGWFTARVLCDLLGVKELVSLKVEHWGITAQPDGKAAIKYPFQLDLKGKNVLVADDITDTGESMKITTDYMQKMNPKSLRTGVLQHISSTSKFNPDFYGEEVDWHWYVYPWNFFEDMANLIPKIFKEKEELTESQVNTRLKEKYNFELKNKKLNETLSQLEKKGSLKKHGHNWKKA